MLDNKRIRIAMQKSGRLSDDSRELLSRCGIKINLQQQRLIAFAEICLSIFCGYAMTIFRAW